ncbi:MAG: phosphatidylglycerol lysyltransferase domain-containing protein [Nanoarchaeota archaeon]
MQEIQLKDKTLFDRYFNRFPPVISELTFTNLFCWTQARPIIWEERQGHLLIKAAVMKPFFFMPVGAAPEKLLPSIDAPVLRTDESFAAKAKALGFAVEEDRPQEDYVYAQGDLATLQGSRYEEKRSFVNSATALSPEVEEVSLKNRDECLVVMEDWCRKHNCEGELLKGEYDAIQASFRCLKELAVQGVAVRVNGIIEAFALGEPLNQDTYVIHFEKANNDYRGLSAFVNKAFAERLSAFPWINREQDLGIPGLRKAKLSYHPSRLVKKFSVRPA